MNGTGLKDIPLLSAFRAVPRLLQRQGRGLGGARRLALGLPCDCPPKGQQSSFVCRGQISHVASLIFGNMVVTEFYPQSRIDLIERRPQTQL